MKFIFVHDRLLKTTTILSLIIAPFLLSSVQEVEAAISCENDAECEQALLKGSKCSQEGYCTNPFYENGGCLATLLDDWDKVRVCGSSDPPEAAKLGLCRSTTTSRLGEGGGDDGEEEEGGISSSFASSLIDYMEVRMVAQNWESPFFQTWILQILLSEVLGVPTSIETGVAGMSNDFYGIDSPLNYGSYDPLFAELTVSADVLDCRLIDNEDVPPEEYKACGHYVPEIWETEELMDVLGEGTAGPLRDVGALAKQGWFIPKFTAEKDVSLTNYLGLQGEENRRKLAERFKRPTTWNEYCEEVSPDGCTTGDDVTSRPPDSDEEHLYFKDGLYTGHFRATDANNCTLNPTTCTGHFADYPCGWRSFNEQQQYHLQIALQSDGDDPAGGYSYSRLVEIWKAANFTKSDVIIMWWYPEAMYQNFIGTDSEFIPVVLPTTTQECLQNRMTRDLRCEDDFDASTTDPKGSCDYRVHGLSRLVGESLRRATYDPSIPVALQSPAFETMENIRITTYEFGDIFKKWFDRKIDHWNFDPRNAVCEWVVENLDHVLTFIPDDYPRVIQEAEASKSMDPFYVAAMVVACVAAILIIAVCIMIQIRKNTKIMFYAQIEFLSLILAGLFIMAVSAILWVVPPTDGTCVALAWLANIGYAVYLPPLVARVFAVNALLGNSGKRMQRVRVSQKRLYTSILAVVTLVCIFLIVWTSLDAPQKLFYWTVTDSKTDHEELIVVATDYCGSSEYDDVWLVISLAWQAALLVPATVIALGTCRNREASLNDTKPMAIVVLSALLLLVCRVLVYALLDESKQADSMAYMSLLTSADVFVAVCVYVFPKFLAANREKNDQEDQTESEMLPDLFLKSTIMVSDVVGFSAWSSVREPVHVFKLLETLYESFDQIAEKHKVFKVETVRDCYVCATGVPLPQQDHAERMARFSIDVLIKMDHISKKCEMMFGPDTADLSLRIGIHSGPVTGGFLKGKGARFQLFGDTMTTACLIQNTSMSNRIHVSKETADILVEAGKKRWLQPRVETIQTEEKGELETYWLTHKVKNLGGFSNQYAASSHGVTSELDSNDDLDEDVMDSEDRWVEWNVDKLSTVLREIVAQRSSGKNKYFTTSTKSEDGENSLTSNTMPLEEVVEIIELPEFDKKAAKRQRDNIDVELDPEVVAQLKDLVTQICKMYNKSNPFHNFAHASYVVMAVTKYMNRIMAASEVDLGFDEDRQRSSTQETLHNASYGIISDPLTRFACLFSALIHDIDHPGVPNPRFCAENERLAGVYKNRSVAEQNSMDLAWAILMEDCFSKLRSAICSNSSELSRFRQLVINAVMATDLGDAELKKLRNGRWEKAFAESVEAPKEDPRDARNRKATIVIEHLIQAADIAHTCQHWSIYRKWNQRLFEECYIAYRDGRAEKNPADGWYNGELGFYDFYIIPLAKKLRDCGVFGPTSDENLDYANKNRAMWEKEGKQITAEMLEKAEELYREQYAPISDTAISGTNNDPNEFVVSLKP